ncbi:hypothetical protein Ndes2526B_g06705 [Nannochloris sp. 'desiccata']
MSSSPPNPSVVIVMGVSGCGKSTVASLVAQRLRCPFIEGDRYHSEENIAKMRSGQPLSDNDRADWLTTLASIIHTSSNPPQFLVLSCSALKPEYRNTLSSTTSPGTVGFVLLEPTKRELQWRLGHRQSHFMPSSLLDSQLQTLSYCESELFMHLKPKNADELMAPAEELASMVVNKLLLPH